MFYERTTFTCNGKAVHGWKVVYPLAERAASSRRFTAATNTRECRALRVSVMAGPLGEAARPSQGVAKRG